MQVFTKEQIKVLLLHELMHIGVDITEKGNLKKYLVPHSIQDFRYILEKYGLNWDAPYQQLEFDFN